MYIQSPSVCVYSSLKCGRLSKCSLRSFLVTQYVTMRLFTWKCHYEENPVYQPLEGSLDQTRTWIEGAMYFLDLAYLISQHYLSKFMGSRWGKNGNSDKISWAPKSLWMVTAAMRLKDDCSLEEKL